MRVRIIEVSIDDLVIDDRVQRSLAPKVVRRISEAFNPPALGVITVSKRKDGTLAVIDGQHRIAGARAAGYANKITARVFEGLTMEEEASLFIALNQTVKPLPIDTFNARVTQGDPAAVGIQAVALGHGWTIGREPRMGVIKGIASVDRLVVNGWGVLRDGQHLDLFSDTLGVITRAWGHDHRGAAGDLIAGIGAFIAKHRGAVNTTRLAAVLSGVTPNYVLARSRTIREMDGLRIFDAVAKFVTTLYNKGLRTTALPDWQRTQ